MGDELRRIAADLREAKRYCRQEPDPASGYYHANIGEARRQAALCVEALNESRASLDAYSTVVVERLATNLSVGVRLAFAMPDLLRCYLECAADEIDILAGPIEIEEVVNV